MDAVSELYLFTKLPVHIFESGIITSNIAQLADYSSKYTTFVKILKSEAERLRFNYYLGGSNLLIAMHLYKIQDLEPLRNILSSCFDNMLYFGMGNTALGATKGYIRAQKTSTPVFIYHSNQDEVAKNDNDILNILQKSEYQEPVNPEMALAAKEAIYDIDPDFFREKLNEFQKLISKFKGNLSAFDILANQNPEAYISMLNVIKAISSIAQFLIESDIIPPEDFVSEMAQQDLASGISHSEDGASKIDGQEESSKPDRSAPIGTIRQVYINGRMYQRIKGDDGKWHFQNRGKVASEGGHSQGLKPGQLRTGNENSANQNVK